MHTTIDTQFSGSLDRDKTLPLATLIEDAHRYDSWKGSSVE